MGMSYILLILTQYMLSNPSILQLSSTYTKIQQCQVNFLVLFLMFNSVACVFSVYVDNVRQDGDKVYLVHSVEINSVLHSTQWYSCKYRVIYTYIRSNIKKSLIICTCVTLNNSRVECNMLLCDIELSSRTIPFEITPRHVVFNSGYSWLSLRYTGDLFRTS